MKNKIWFKMLSPTLVAALLISYFTTAGSAVVSAQETSTQMTTIEELKQKLNDSSLESFCEFYERDENGRITNKTTRCNGVEISTTYSYAADGSYTESSTTQSYTMPEYNSSIQSESISTMSVADLGNISYMDNYIKDPYITDQINVFGAAYNKAWDLPEAQRLVAQDTARIRANLIRADYVCSAPFSDYAINVMGGDRSLPLSRVLSTDLGDTKCFDVMVIQRKLMLDGYIEPDDIPDEDFGYYEESTAQSVLNYQIAKGFAPSDQTGTVYRVTFHSLFDYAPSSNYERNNYSDVLLAGASRINLFRAKHNFVRDQFAVELARNVGAINILKEKRVYYPGEYIPGYEDKDFKLNSYGSVDVLRLSLMKNVWEVKAKPKDDNTLRWYRVQVRGYEAASQLPINLSSPKRSYYCPFYRTPEIHRSPLPIPYGANEKVEYWTGSGLDTGLLFYTSYDNEKEQEQGQEVYNRQTSPSREYVEYEYDTAGALAGRLIVNGLVILIIAIGAILTTFVVIL